MDLLIHYSVFSLYFPHWIIDAAVYSYFWFSVLSCINVDLSLLILIKIVFAISSSNNIFIMWPRLHSNNMNSDQASLVLSVCAT